MTPKPINNSSLQSLKNTIDFKKNYLLTLRKRLVLIKKDFVLKNEYERNEVEIVTYQTLSIINNTTAFIKQREIQYNTELNQFYSDLDEMEREYESVLERAKKSQSDNISIKHLLYHVNWKYIDDNIDEKINLFKNIKEILA